jgi:hypothetical protein
MPHKRCRTRLDSQEMKRQSHIFFQIQLGSVWADALTSRGHRETYARLPCTARRDPFCRTYGQCAGCLRVCVVGRAVLPFCADVPACLGDSVTRRGCSRKRSTQTPQIWRCRARTASLTSSLDLFSGVRFQTSYQTCKSVDRAALLVCDISLQVLRWPRRTLH